MGHDEKPHDAGSHDQPMTLAIQRVVDEFDRRTGRRGEGGRAMSEMTEWFPASVKPVRVGVYEVTDINGHFWFSMWKDGLWHNGIQDDRRDLAIAAAAKQWARALTPRALWRGLTAPAEQEAR